MIKIEKNLNNVIFEDFILYVFAKQYLLKKSIKYIQDRISILYFYENIFILTF
jgi:hypothetical protein